MQNRIIATGLGDDVIVKSGAQNFAKRVLKNAVKRNDLRLHTYSFRIEF
jgi:hypothetical protein